MKPFLLRLEEMNTVEGASLRDPRSQFQERIQAKFGTVPEYVVTGQDGPAHSPTFRVEVRVQGDLWGMGEGGSKRDAIREAAVVALRQADERLG